MDHKGCSTIAVGVHAVDSQACSATVKCNPKSATSRPTNCCISFTNLGAAGHLRLYRKLWMVRGEQQAATSGDHGADSKRTRNYSAPTKNQPFLHTRAAVVPAANPGPSTDACGGRPSSMNTRARHRGKTLAHSSARPRRALYTWCMAIADASHKPREKHAQTGRARSASRSWPSPPSPNTGGREYSRCAGQCLTRPSRRQGGFSDSTSALGSRCACLTVELFSAQQSARCRRAPSVPFADATVAAKDGTQEN